MVAWNVYEVCENWNGCCGIFELQNNIYSGERVSKGLMVSIGLEMRWHVQCAGLSYCQFLCY